ncbi:MAG: class I SAM-dependent methyltransferase, partial [Allorhizobium sp.]
MTPLLRAAFPEAHIACVDNSPEMLASARESLAADGNVSFWQASMETYAPSAPVQVVFCNAALHWARDQLGVMARMVDWLTPGGVLAIQMPHTQQQPSHLLMDALLR